MNYASGTFIFFATVLVCTLFALVFCEITGANLSATLSTVIACCALSMAADVKSETRK